MGALRQQRDAGYQPVVAKKHSRTPTQPDYDDEVTEEQLKELERQVAPVIESDEWELVDGPAW